MKSETEMLGNLLTVFKRKCVDSFISGENIFSGKKANMTIYYTFSMPTCLDSFISGAKNIFRVKSETEMLG